MRDSQAAAAVSRASTEGTPLRVLVVDDSEEDSLLLLRELRCGGYAPNWERVDTAAAVMYLREVGVEPTPSEAAVNALNVALSAEIEVEDLTGQVDPRVTGALLELKSPSEALEHIGELRQRLAACQLFASLLEAGFLPENNWEEALESQESALDLAHQATQGNRELLKEAFGAYASLPDEARLRRLAYLAEATAHVEAMVGGSTAAPAA